MTLHMNQASRDFVLAGLLLIAFAAAGYKVSSRAQDSTFAISATKTSSLSSKAIITGEKPRFEAQFVSSNPGQAVHAPSIVELMDGSLRAVWFSGSR